MVEIKGQNFSLGKITRAIKYGTLRLEVGSIYPELRTCTVV